MLHSQNLHNPEHRQWNQQHVGWLEDLEVWRNEDYAARDGLRAAEQKLLNLHNLYEEHRKAMVALEQEFHRLEHTEASPAELTELRHRQAVEALRHEHLAYRRQAILGTVAQLKALMKENI